MHQPPDTHNSLIVRLRDPRDVQAWAEFTEIYQPLVYRLARGMNMQHSDAVDATQEVMLHLTDAVRRWQPDRSRGTFRGWLHQVAKNVMLRFMERQNRQPRTSGNTSNVHKLSQLPEEVDTASVFDSEFKRHVFAWAARRVQAEFEARSWSAFWETFVAERAVAEYSRSENISTGAIYIARCRVLKRLREIVEEQLNNDWRDVPAESLE
jgi:RNA polymerase sigma-70 factor (ECF subfamily)